MESIDDFDFTPHVEGIIDWFCATGYDINTSLLEFSDNSISKNSSNIQFQLYQSETKLVEKISICDDGDGMIFKELCNSWIIARIKKRETTDIGRYHVGMKSAISNLGNRCVILSKKRNEKTVGLYADINLMKTNNSYAPTSIESDVNEKWAQSYMPINIFNKFREQESGTLIYICDIKPSALRSGEDVRDKLICEINKAYRIDVNKCKIWVQLDNEVNYLTNPLDLFYSQNRDSLSEDPYETTIKVYTGGSGTSPERVVECITQARNITETKDNRKKHLALISANTMNPIYCEYRQRKKAERALTGNNMEQIAELPNKLLIGEMHCRMVCVTKETDSKEDELLEGTLKTSRKGFYFLRDGMRMTGHALKIGQPIHDRAQAGGGDERSRMLVTFTSSLDKYIGIMVNKTVKDNELNSKLITDTLFTIYEQVKKPWVEKAAACAKKEESNMSEIDKTHTNVLSMLKKPEYILCKNTTPLEENTHRDEELLESCVITMPTSNPSNSITLLNAEPKPLYESADISVESCLISMPTSNPSNSPTFINSNSTPLYEAVDTPVESRNINMQISNQSNSPKLLIRFEDTAVMNAEENNSLINNEVITNEPVSSTELDIHYLSIPSVSESCVVDIKKKNAMVEVKLNEVIIGNFEYSKTKTKRDLIAHIKTFFL